MKKMLLLSALAILLAGCKEGPKIWVCASYPEDGGFRCYHSERREFMDVPYEESRGYIAFPPDDAETLLNFCQLRKNPQN